MNQRMTRILNLGSALFAGAVFLSACTKPKEEVRQYKTSTVEFKMSIPEIHLQTKSSLLIEVKDQKLPMDQAYQFALDLHELGLNSQKNELTELALKWAGTFVSASDSTAQGKVKDLPFIDAAAGATYSSTQAAVSEISSMLGSQENLILDYLRETPLRISEGVPTLQMVAALKSYLNSLKRFLKSPQVDPMVRKEMETELDLQVKTQLAPAERILKKLDAAKELSVILDTAEELARQFEVRLDRNAKSNLAFGRKLDEKLKDSKTSEQILSVAVDIWEFYNPEERLTTIKPFSAELYDFFNGLDRDQLDCYALRKSCGFMTSIEKYFVEMKVSNQGVEAVRGQIRKAVTDGARSVIRGKVRAELLKIPSSLIAKQVKSQFQKFHQKITGITDNYRELVTKIVENWSRKNLDREFYPGFDATEIQFSTSSTDSSQQTPMTSAFSTRILPLGTSARLLLLRNQGSDLSKTSKRRIYFDLINRIMAIGGAKDHEGKINGSLLMRVSAVDPFRDPVDITAIGKDSSLVLMPDQLNLLPQKGAGFRLFGQGLDLPESRVSLRTQADLLDSWTQVIRELRDWEKTGFDQSLSGFSVKDYLPKEYQDGNIQGELFPKSQMFALAVANSLQVLQSLSAAGGPLFVINAREELSFDRKAFSESEDKITRTIVKAGLVNMKKALGSPAVQEDLVFSGDLSRMILTLSKFVDALKDIEKTQAPELQAQLPAIVSAREEVQGLIMGLTNFLASHLLSAQGIVAESYSLSTKTANQRVGQNLQEQMLALRAFVKAHQLFGLAVYKQNALETLSGLQQNYFNQELGFFAERAESKAKLPHWTALPGLMLGLSDALLITQGRSQEEIRALLNSVSQELLKVQPASE